MRLYSVPMLMFIFSMLGCSADEKSGDEQGWEDDDQTWSDAENNCEAESLTGLRVAVGGDMSIAWHTTSNGQNDQLVRVMPIQVKVNGETRSPCGVGVEIISGYPDVHILQPEAVQSVAYPDETWIPTSDQYPDLCIDENGETVSGPEMCSWFWDAEEEQAYQIQGGLGSESDYSPNYLVGETNADGTMFAMVVIDAMPVYGNSEASMFGTVTITTSIGVDTTTFEVRVEEG